MRRAHSSPRTGPRREQAAQGIGEHAVAGIDALLGAPDRPDGGAMAAELVAVLDVVVDQREVVDQLDGDGRGERPVRVSAERLARPERQRRADALPGGIVCRAALRVRPPKVVCGHLAEQPTRPRPGLPETVVEQLRVPVEKRGQRLDRRRCIDVEYAFRHGPPPARKLSTS